jgi:ATP-dependent Clp protease ATP-binding subunit ClpB
MRLDKFTLRGQEAIQSAIELAERNQHQQVEPEHLLVAMLSLVFRACRAGNSISVRA